MHPSTLYTLQALRRGDLAGARELRLPGGLTEFPPEIFGLADTLELLDLSGGSLTHLPDDIGRLHRLKVLFCSGNRFERLPPALGDCCSLSQLSFRGSGLREIPGEALPPSVRWLTLTGNRIVRLPKELGQRKQLQKLMLAGNRLRQLPPELADLPDLELVRLGSNRLTELPTWLAELPRLAWVSWSGNPLERETVLPETGTIPWAQLDVGDLLGEGASGRVHRALWRNRPAMKGRPVALKLFKSAITSDGLPDCEITACLAAGEHPNLTGGIGRLVDHPDGAQGLLMRLLPSHWRALANPPSLSSCTRDVYDPEARMKPTSVLGVAHSAAAAAAHLHARGLLHGDLYGHNVVWDGEAGQAVLADFGAASLLSATGQSSDFQRIEVRAWGLLLGELLALCTTEPAGALHLRSLQQECVQPNPSARPLMVDVVRIVSGLRQTES